MPVPMRSAVPAGPGGKGEKGGKGRPAGQTRWRAALPRGFAAARNENGAALVLAMLAVIVMTMLGLVLMGVLRSSYVQVAATESNVQAEQLAQKGIDETLSLIRQAVDEVNRSTAGSADVRAKWTAANAAFARLRTTWDSLVNREVESSRGSYRIAVRWEPIRTDPDVPRTLPDAPYVLRATVTSTGAIPGSGPHRTAAKTMTVYISTINPVFRYPVSAADRLTLNGYSSIVGNVLSEGELAVSNEALFVGLPGSLYGVGTQLPAIRGFVRAEGGYRNRLLPAPAAPDWSPSYFSSVFPFEDRSLEPGEPIRVYDDYVKPQMERLDRAAADAGYAELLPDGIEGIALDADRSADTRAEGWTTIAKDVRIGGNLAVIGGVFAMRADGGAAPTLTVKNGSVYVRYPDSPDLVAADLSGSIRLDGPDRVVAVDGDALLNDGFSLKGSLYVRGNLKIVGNVDIDGAIYVGGEGENDGTVELKEATSINAAARQPVVIVASGGFRFSDNRFGGADTRLRAFLYTEKELHLYGVHSRVRVYGGIHGGDVELDAVGEKGSLSEAVPVRTYAPPNPAGAEAADTMAFTSQSGLAPADSNLQIVYDDSELYELPPTGIPTTSALNVYVRSIAAS